MTNAEKAVQAQILTEIIAQAYLGILRLGFSREEIDMGINGIMSSMQRKARASKRASSTRRKL